MSNVHVLPGVPGTPFRALDFTANEGAWEGALDEVRWGYEKGWLRSQVRRALIRRRWFQVTIATEAVVITLWIRDEGTTGAARLFITDLKAGEVIAHRSASGRPLGTLQVGPFSGAGTDAWLRSDSCEVTLQRSPTSTSWRLIAHWDGVEIDLELHAAGAVGSTVIGSHGHRRPGLTSKHCLLPVSGTASIPQRTLDLSTALGAVTYTNGFFPKDSRWFEATGLGRAADGRRIGLGISDGNRHGKVQEHVLWVDDALYQTPRARILVGGRVARDVWRFRSAHGDFELKFRPKGGDVDVEKRVMNSQRTHRVAGVFMGRIPTPDGPLTLEALPGLCEDHRPS